MLQRELEVGDKYHSITEPRQLYDTFLCMKTNGKCDHWDGRLWSDYSK